MKRAFIAIVAPLVVLGGLAITRGAGEVRDIKHTIENWSYELEHSSDPVALNVGFLPMYVDGHNVGKLQTVVVQRAEPGAVDSLLVLVKPGADGLGEHAGCSFRFDPEAFERSGPMGYRNAVHCVTAAEAAEAGLVRFGSVVFENIGHQAALYLDAAHAPCGHMGDAGADACSDLKTELRAMREELRTNLRRELRSVRGQRIEVNVDVDKINAEVQKALEEARAAMEEAQIEIEAAADEVSSVRVEIKNR
jgi:hypothetical protein